MHVPTLKKVLTIALVYLISLLLPFGLEHVADLFNVKPYNHRDHWYHAIFNAGFWYQRLVTLNPRSPRVHYVQVITIRAGDEPPGVLGQNLCGPQGQRAFLSKLLRKLSGADPSVIVIDKWFGPTTCPADDEATKELRETVATVSKQTPIVIGLKGDTLRDIDRTSPEQAADLEKRGFTHGDQVLESRLQFKDANGVGNLTYGMATLEVDVRRIPLRWLVFQQLSDVGKKEKRVYVSSLSLVAAQQFDGAAGDDLVRFPYAAGFLQQEEMQRHSALNLICGSRPNGPSDWNSCGAEDGDRHALGALRHRIVLIGEINPTSPDFHESPIGIFPGVFLQANYIEALLDDRYLKQLPKWLLVILSALWFLSIEEIFRRYSAVPGRALFRGLAVSAGFGLLFYYVAVIVFGYYLALLPTGILAVFLRYFLRLARADF